jgi:hypothetical protein
MRQSEWIAANAAERNIRLILHMGDITNNNTPDQWQVAATSMKLLDGIVPYVLNLGNHDVSAGDGLVRDRKSTMFNEWFEASNFPLLAGLFEENRLDNSYHMISLGGVSYLILSLEYAPRDAVLDWANQVIAAHPDHKVIIVTHAYTNSRGQHVSFTYDEQAPEGAMNDGLDIWAKLVNKHANIFMVLSGHIGVPSIPRTVSLNSKGGGVYEMLTDYQSEPNGGNGWMLLLEFRSDDTIRAQVYSPYLEAFKTDVDPYGFSNDFVIDLIRKTYRKP